MHEPGNWPNGDTEMARRIRALDWAATALGPIQDWPQSLKTSVDVILAMPGPATLLWGPQAVQIYNDAYITIARDRHPDNLGRPVAEGWADVYAQVIAPLLDAGRQGRATQLKSYPVRFETPDGPEVRMFDTDWSPVRGESGEVAGVLQTLVETTERRRAEAALRESEERLLQFGEASSDVLWMRDTGSTQWTYLTRAFEKIYGISREDALAGDNLANWVSMILPDDRQHALESLERVSKGERAEFEYRIRRPADGQIRWLRDTDFPMFDESGEVARIGGIGQDITALKRAERHQRTLLAELQHRVRNTLAVVRSIARRTAENSVTVDDMLAHFQGRLDAFSRVQAALTRSAEARVDLESLIEDEFVAHAAREGRQLSIDGPSVMLEPKTAEQLSLAIHELTTNAVKHGALSGTRGRIDVRWKHVGDGEEELVLTWDESGVEVDDRDLEHEGFGMELLRRSLPYDLEATTEVELRPHGLRFELRMPLRPPPSAGN